MHLRASQIIGIPVVDDGTQQIVGFLHAPLIDPDTGRILGFFVLSAFLGGGEMFLQSLDIAAWGTRVHIRSEECLSPPEELIRLRSALEDPRLIIGQRIRTKTTNRCLGICRDIQFNTRHFMAEWIFPRRFFMSRQPLPMSDILEITPEAIIVKDPLRPVRAPIQKEIDDSPVVSEVVPLVQTQS